MSEAAPKRNWVEWVFPKRTGLGDDLTTIDWLKTAALALMLVDHIGYYIFPEIEWFRVLGRLCVPLWFFLIGYANSRELPTRWIVAVFILMAANLTFGLPPLPLSILMTMLLIRASINPLMGWLERHAHYFWWVVLLLIFAMYPTNLLVEYGTMGMLMAMCGYAVRHRDAVASAFGEGVPAALMIVTYVAFAILSSMIFAFSWGAVAVLAAGLVAVYFVLQGFEGRIIEGSAGHAQAPLVRFTGRYTLEIYVVHLLLFKVFFAMQMATRALIGT